MLKVNWEPTNDFIVFHFIILKIESNFTVLQTEASLLDLRSVLNQQFLPFAQKPKCSHGSSNSFNYSNLKKKQDQD